ncbi:MAG: dienelactone hydrolase family protein [Pseudomonadota bacterium]|nr:dienelactone hydrolase family protein [Pseudomonadota bacterium]
MKLILWRFSLLAMLLFSRAALLPNAHAADDNKTRPGLSFVQFPSPNLQTGGLLTLKGKLSFPSAGATGSPFERRKLPAVLILHGSSGVDARGDFYEAALNAAGFVTLQIDMWEARGVTGIANRPQAPILTYPDAFSALAFLSADPRIDAARIGVVGFSWGGVVSLGAAERLYAGNFGGGRRFAAHVANYPVCYGANNTSIPALNPPAAVGTQFLNLTGAPVLIQIGSNDDYDNGVGPCQRLAASVNPGNNHIVEVQTYPGAYHAFDRLMIPVVAPDPFGNEGSYFTSGVVPVVRIVPNVDQAYQARDRAVAFFKQHL